MTAGTEHGYIVVSSARARSTGTEVEIIDNRDGSFDSCDLNWFNHCVPHGGVCSHETRALAVRFASAPEIWCPGCQGTDPLAEEQP